MRKSISLIAVLFICVMLVGCKSHNMSEMGYNGALKAIEVLEEYKAFEITNSRAKSEIDYIYDILNQSKNEHDQHVATYILIASCDLLLGNDIDEDIDKIEKAIYD